MSLRRLLSLALAALLRWSAPSGASAFTTSLPLSKAACRPLKSPGLAYRTRDDGDGGKATDLDLALASGRATTNAHVNGGGNGPATDGASKRAMLRFALPALGVYLANPLLSNIDNAFVGRTVGAAGLAALAPATLCIDQALYLFSFLARAATGLASRAYHDPSTQSADEAREKLKAAAAPVLSVSLACGAALSLLYAARAPALLRALRVDPSLHRPAATYIHLRGAVSWAAMAQSILLALFMVAKDAVTPMKIIAVSSILNVIGDAFLCVW